MRFIYFLIDFLSIHNLFDSEISRSFSLGRFPSALICYLYAVASLLSNIIKTFSCLFSLRVFFSPLFYFLFFFFFFFVFLLLSIFDVECRDSIELEGRGRERNGERSHYETQYETATTTYTNVDRPQKKKP